MSTIREVASLAGVSTATVSRVLNNDVQYKMTEETKKRVLDAVKRLDYKNHPAVRKMKAVKREASLENVRIGCILSVTKKKFNDPYFMSILSAIESRLSKRGYQMSFIKTGVELSDSDALRAAFAKPVDGLILMESFEEKAYDFIRENTACIVGIDTRERDIDNVGYDHFEVAGLAMRHLIEKGHKRIGFIGGHGNGNSLKDGQRYKGYFFAMHEAELEINEDWVIDCEWDEDICAEKIDRLCKSGNYPTAFFAASDLMAMAALNSMYNNHIDVPDQIAVIGASDIEISRYSNPPLSTVRVPVEQIGTIAAEVLIERLEGCTFLPRRVLLPAELIVRSST